LQGGGVAINIVPHEMHIFHLPVIFVSGVVAGVINSIAGGGTILTFPALIFAGLPPMTANATSTLSLLPSAMGYTFGYRKNIPAVWHWIKKFAFVSLVGGWLGSVLLVRTPTAIFDWLVPFLILLATVLFTAHSFFARLFRMEIKHHKSGPDWKWQAGAIFFQFVVSVYGGYFGAGIGILMLATLGMLGVGNIHEMNAVKGILGFLINVIAAGYFILHGLIHWPAAGVMAAGSVIGGYSGSWLAQKIPQRMVRNMIAGIGLLLTVLMFVKQRSH
jgi:uncharacterized protein